MAGPPARWIAPSTPPPPMSDELAAFTMASHASRVMSPGPLITRDRSGAKKTCSGLLASVMRVRKPGAPLRARNNSMRQPDLLHRFNRLQQGRIHPLLRLLYRVQRGRDRMFRSFDIPHDHGVDLPGRLNAGQTKRDECKGLLEIHFLPPLICVSNVASRVTPCEIAWVSVLWSPVFPAW